MKKENDQSEKEKNQVTIRKMTVSKIEIKPSQLQLH